MGRPAKTLVEFVQDGTFRGRRHGALLAGPDLPWPGLVPLQRQYRAARSEPERRAAALAFEQAVQAIHEQTALEQASGASQSLEADLALLGKPGSSRQLIAFLPAYLAHTSGALRGQPFEPEPWQRSFLRELYRRDKQGRRVYRLGVLSLPRGNGKTFLAATIALYELVSRPDEPEILLAAGSRAQAGICLRFARSLVEQGPLAEWVRFKRGMLVCEASGGSIQVISSQGALQHGLRPSVVILDELWNFTTKAQRELYVALDTSLHKREDAFLLVISTAGFERYSLLAEIHQHALAWPDVQTSRKGCLTVCKDTENGNLLSWYGAPTGSGIDDQAIWQAANPASWVTLRQLKRQRNDPGLSKADFRRTHLNQWVGARNAWLPQGLWQTLESKERFSVDLPIYVGVDIGLTYDTTAIAWAQKSSDGVILVRCRVWSARPDVLAHVHVDGTVNLQEIEQWILGRLAGRFTINEVAYDPTYFQRSAQLLESNGLLVLEYRPSSAPIQEATQRFYQLAQEHKLAHNGDPVLAAHLDATAATPTELGWKLHKRRNRYPIDATIAAVMAVVRADLQNRPARPRIDFLEW